MIANTRVNEAFLSYIVSSLLCLLLFFPFPFFPLPPLLSPVFLFFFPPFTHPCCHLTLHLRCVCHIRYLVSTTVLSPFPPFVGFYSVSVIHSFSSFLPLSITVCPLYLLIILPPFFSFHCQISCY